MHEILLAAAMFGQVCVQQPHQVIYGPPVVYGAPVIVPPTRVIVPQPVIRTAPGTWVHLVNITVRHREDHWVHYPRGWKKVPVVNGYVPNIDETDFADGSKRIIYDYRCRKPLSECRTPESDARKRAESRRREIEKQRDLQRRKQKQRAPKQLPPIQDDNLKFRTAPIPDRKQEVTDYGKQVPKQEPRPSAVFNVDSPPTVKIKPLAPPKPLSSYGDKDDSNMKRPSDIKDIDNRVISPSYRNKK